MRKFEKPVIFISKCLGQSKCRYDGSVITNEIITALSPFVTFTTVCPEMSIGLPVPREALRIVRDTKGDNKLVFSQTGVDVTQPMNDFSNAYLTELKHKSVDGFILKNRSPSCGFNDVKIYKGIGKSQMIPEKTAGIFGKLVLEQFPLSAVENEGRLLHYNIREHFMIKIFTLSAFKKISETQKLSELIKFHASNKYLFMAFSQQHSKTLGKIVANHQKLAPKEIYLRYGNNLMKTLEHPMSIKRNINVLLHIFGYFKNDLSSDEKAFFLEQLEHYNDKRVPFSVLLNILRTWVIRFEDHYLSDQTIFEPYPLALFTITDSGKGL
jgi:uncharacterized protein YbgA (DUF1722 family)/uncharacterized protein YbbK (DUF523 family)